VSVLQWDHLRDPEELKQLVGLLVQENERLHKRLEELARENAALKGEGEQRRLELEIQRLQEQMDRFQRKIFAASSEKRKAEGNTEGAAEEKAPRRGHGPTEQKRLPVTEVVHELPEEKRGCPVCGGTLEEMAGQCEETEEVTVIQRQFVVQRHRRKKYRCRCNGAVVTAPAPLRLEGHRYSVEFAVEVAVEKYLDHLPLERQVARMGRQGLEVTSQTLWDQMNAVGELLEPSYRALKAHVLASSQIGADETWWRDLKTGSRQCHDWCVCCEDGIYHEIHPNRSAEAAADILRGYTGTVMTDGYVAYKTLAAATPGLKLVHCWAHARRKYVEVEPFYPQECKEILDFIGELYKVERKVPEGLGREEALCLRARLRQEESSPWVDEIRTWAFAQRASPGSGLRKAIEYMLDHWTGLTAFLEDPAIPLDNNATERALRAVVLGRKNHLGSRSKRGMHVAGLFYSLLDTAKLCGVDPREYLVRAVRQALDEPGAVFLPHEMAALSPPPVE
jgi:transposase